MLPALLVLTAGQTTPSPEPLDVRAFEDAAVAIAQIEFCRGQEPQQAAHEDGTPVTLEEARGQPWWVKAYIAQNNAQWEEQCAG